jgi:hypothetical protein
MDDRNTFRTPSPFFAALPTHKMVGVLAEHDSAVRYCRIYRYAHFYLHTIKLNLQRPLA